MLRKLALVALTALSAFLTQPVHAADYGLYNVGDQVTYGRLVHEPDVQLQLIARDTDSGVITIALQSKSLISAHVPQITIWLGATQGVAVKRECAGGHCRAYIVCLTLVQLHPDGMSEVRHSVRIMPSTGPS